MPGVWVMDGVGVCGGGRLLWGEGGCDIGSRVRVACGLDEQLRVLRGAGSHSPGCVWVGIMKIGGRKGDGMMLSHSSRGVHWFQGKEAIEWESARGLQGLAHCSLPGLCKVVLRRQAWG